MHLLMEDKGLDFSFYIHRWIMWEVDHPMLSFQERNEKSLWLKKSKNIYQLATYKICLP